MLHATAFGKSTLYRRYLGNRDEDERKVYEEDEITSTVFGPLDFLPAADVHRFWQRVLESVGHVKFLPAIPPLRSKVGMWVRRKSASDGNSIEPDVVVTMNWADGVSYILLVELKWRAPLSGEDQLHNQWLHYLNETEREQALHLFIAPEVSAGAQAPNNVRAGGDVWQTANGNHLVLLPWLRIRAVLDEFATEDSAFGRWANLADQFLERIQIRRFGGFHQLFAGMSPSDELPPVLFWRPNTAAD